MDYTSVGLINRITRVGGIPEQQPEFDTDDLLDYINEEVRSVIVPWMLSVNEDFFVRMELFTIPASVTDGIRLPRRVTGARIREIKLYNGTTETSNSLMTDLPRMDIDDLGKFPGDGWYFKGSRLYFNDPSCIGTGEKLAIWYYVRPSELVRETECAKISAIDTTTKTVTCVTVPADFTTSLTYDIIQGTPHFETMAFDQTAATIVSNEISFASLPTDLAVGDYIAKAEETPVVNLPLEIQDLLAYGVALKIASSNGSPQTLQQIASVYQQMQSSAVRLLSPRVDGEARVIVGDLM